MLVPDTVADSMSKNQQELSPYDREFTCRKMYGVLKYPWSVKKKVIKLDFFALSNVSTLKNIKYLQQKF